ncbi:LuxR C-terminal-related transcriptional regulator [Nakamurella sp.]|uniref:LuxR C-terminal-related transcriptional regulator n=1 Tax=Nakamurella sp. TaxID=1869182 RepID=UPI003B3B0194
MVEGLRARIAAATADRVGTSLCVLGPAGIGKTHLIRSLLDPLDRPSGDGPAPGTGPVTVLRAAGDHRRRHEPFAVLGQLTGPTPPGDDPADVVFDRVDELCGSGPLVVWVDDAHHADAASLAGLRRLVWAGRSLPLTVVLSARPFPQPDQLDLLLRQVGLIVELPPLDRMMTERLVHDRTGRWPGPRLRHLLDAAGGNPLFVGEVLRALVESDGLRPAGEAVEVAAGVAVPAAALDGVIRGHLAELDDTATELLAALAVWGTPAAPDDLAEMLYSTPDALAPALDRAVRSGVVVVENSWQSVDFTHDLFREVTYDAVPEATRRRLHRRVAAVLTERGAGPAPVAEHLLQAARPRRDGPDLELLAALNGAVEASGRFAPQVAADLLRVVDELTAPDDPAGEERLLQQARELFRAGRGAAAERLVLERIGRIKDPAVAAGLQRVLITSQINRADVDGALVSIGHTLAIERLPPPVRRALFAQRQWVLLLGGRFGELEDLDELTRVTRAADDRPAETSLRLTAAVLAYVRGDPGQALRRFAEWPELASGEPGELVASTAMVWPAMFRLQLEGPRASVGTLVEARATAAQLGSPWVNPFLGAVAAGAAWTAGDWDGAVAEADAALETAEETGTGWISITIGERIDIDARRGQVRAARRRLEDFRSRRLPAQFGRGDVDVAEISLLEAEGRVVEATDLAERYWAGVRTQPGLGGEDFAIDVVRLAVVGLRPALVEQVVADVERIAPSECSPGVLDMVCGIARADPVRIRRAHEVFAARGYVGRSWQALDELACALAAAGDRPGAVAAMEAAVAGYEQVRAVVDRDRLLARMRLLGVRRGSRQAHRSQAGGWDALTATERRIADLVREGLTNREIAARLFVSPRTVQSHVSHILEKTGLRSRVEVAAAVPAFDG